MAIAVMLFIALAVGLSLVRDRDMFTSSRPPKLRIATAGPRWQHGQWEQPQQAERPSQNDEIVISSSPGDARPVLMLSGAPIHAHPRTLFSKLLGEQLLRPGRVEARAYHSQCPAQALR